MVNGSSIMIIDLRKFEVAEKLPPGEEILKRCSNFSAIIDQAHTAYYSFRIHTKSSYWPSDKIECRRHEILSRGQ